MTLNLRAETRPVPSAFQGVPRAVKTVVSQRSLLGKLCHDTSVNQSIFLHVICWSKSGTGSSTSKCKERKWHVEQEKECLKKTTRFSFPIAANPAGCRGAGPHVQRAAAEPAEQAWTSDCRQTHTVRADWSWNCTAGDIRWDICCGVREVYLYLFFFILECLPLQLCLALARAEGKFKNFHK